MYGSGKRFAVTPRFMIWGVWLAAVCAVMVYNGWRLSCGKCCYADLWNIPWPAWGFLLMILVANGVLLPMRRKARRRRTSTECPGCGREQHGQWCYCPYCGEIRQTIE